MDVVAKGFLSPEINHRLEKPAYLTPGMIIASAYVLIDSFENCCKSATYTEAAIAFSIFTIVYNLYIFLRKFLLDEVTLSGLLDFDIFLSFGNFLCWVGGIALLTFTDGGVFNVLGLGYAATWANFFLSGVDWFFTWGITPYFDDGGQGTFNYRVTWTCNLIAAIFLITAIGFQCLLGKCQDGEEIGLILGFINVALSVWTLVFIVNNPYKTWVYLVQNIIWLIAIIILTIDTPFFVDGLIFPNYFFIIWVGYIFSIGLLNNSNYDAPSQLVSFFSPLLLSFVFTTIIILAAQPSLVDICHSKDDVANATNSSDINTTSSFVSMLSFNTPDFDSWDSLRFFIAEENVTVNETDDVSNESEESKLCTIFDTITLAALGLNWLIVLVITILRNYCGTADASDTLRIGSRFLLFIWTVTATILTFPVESPFVTASAGYFAIWLAFGLLSYLSFFAEETVEYEGGTLGDFEHYIITGKAGSAFANLRNKAQYIRIALFLLAIGSLSHFIASVFACANKDEEHGDTRCTPEELFAVCLGSVTLLALTIFILFFSRTVELLVKVFLGAIWVFAGWVPIQFGPYDTIHGNGYFSSIVVIISVLAFILVDPGTRFEE